MLLKTKELADRLGVHPQTIRRMVERDQIPVVKLSKTEFRFDLNEVKAALNLGELDDE